MANGNGSTLSPGQGGALGLLGNPLFTGGLGLLAGALDDDVSTGRAFQLGLLGAESGLQFGNQMQKNEANRRQLIQEARQRRARQELLQRATAPVEAEAGSGLLSAPLAGNQGEMLGLLSDAFPEQVGERLANQLLPEATDDPLVTLGNGMQTRFSELPADAQELIAAGFVPGTPEFSDIIRQQVAEGNMTQADRVQARAAATMAEIEARREMRSERSRAFNTEGAISGTLRNLRELRRINDRLRGTIGETGLGFDSVRQAAAQGLAALKSLTGFGDQRARDVLNDLKRFETLALEENVGNIGTLKENIGGRVTQFEFEKYLETGPSPSNPPDVNNRIILDQLREFKRLAEFEDVDVPKYVDEEIERLERDLSTEGTVNVGEPEFGSGDTFTTRSGARVRFK